MPVKLVRAPEIQHRHFVLPQCSLSRHTKTSSVQSKENVPVNIMRFCSLSVNIAINGKSTKVTKTKSSDWIFLRQIFI